MSRYPYTSTPSALVQLITHLRRVFPTTVNAETIRKLNIAPKNESYLINALQFIGIIDQECRRTDRGQELFVKPDADFQMGLKDLIRQAYNDLFEVRGEDAWTLPRSDLVSYFRTVDRSSEVIGTRQASLFQALVALTEADGKDSFRTRPRRGGDTPKQIQREAKRVKADRGDVSERMQAPTQPPISARDVSLSVRIEINLPSDATRETYDNIFQSIKANLINE